MIIDKSSKYLFTIFYRTVNNYNFACQKNKYVEIVKKLIKKDEFIFIFSIKISLIVNNLFLLLNKCVKFIKILIAAQRLDICLFFIDSENKSLFKLHLNK